MANVWSSPIKIEAKQDVAYDLSVVGFHPSGKIYVVYVAGKDIMLSSYDGATVTHELNLSETELMCYTPYLHICKNGYIHIVWIEAESLGADKQTIKYRFHDGVEWSEIITLKVMIIPGELPGGFVDRKVEDMRMAADENNNLFIAMNQWPAGRCAFFSKYGDANTKEEGWPMADRSKHPDVAVDKDYVHIAWQQRWSGKYTIAYCRRPNTPTAKWEQTIDAGPAVHRPRVTVDNNNLQHIIMMDDVGATRVIYYKYFIGNNKFSDPNTVTDRDRAYYNTCINALDKDNLLITDSSGSMFFYNWLQKGKWTGHKQIPTGKIRSKFITNDLSPTGKCVVAVIDNYKAVYILTNDGVEPPAPPTGPTGPTAPTGPTGPTAPIPPTTCGLNYWYQHLKTLNFKAAWDHLLGKHAS
jgi:hypothetical protein